MEKKKWQGMMTVEATIMLTLFFCFYMAFMSLINMVKVQSLLQYSVDQTAKEISAYSYVLTKSGVTAQVKKTSAAAAQFKSDTDGVLSSLNDLNSALGSGNVQTVVNQTQVTVDTIDNYLENTDIYSGVVNMLKSGAESAAAKLVLGSLAKTRIKQNLESAGITDPDGYLESLGVVDGLDGISFSDSAWIAEGKPILRITASYKLSGNFFWIKTEDREFHVNATTGIW